MTESPKRQLLAEGRLNWPTAERRTNRYGAVNIQTAGRDPGEYEREQVAKLVGQVEVSHGQSSIIRIEEDSTAEHATFAKAPIGIIGRLAVKVVTTRESYHVGDLFREIKPTTPEVGELIVLGEGELFVETDGYDGTPSIGVRPEDGRETDWMDPLALYRAHSQTVELYFEPRLS